MTPRFLKLYEEAGAVIVVGAPIPTVVLSLRGEDADVYYLGLISALRTRISYLEYMDPIPDTDKLLATGVLMLELLIEDMSKDHSIFRGIVSTDTLQKVEELLPTVVELKQSAYRHKHLWQHPM